MAKKTGAEVTGFCGQAGRIARAQLRNGDLDSGARRHLESCPCCKQKIARAFEKNEETSYTSGNLEDLLVGRRVNRFWY